MFLGLGAKSFKKNACLDCQKVQKLWACVRDRPLHECPIICLGSLQWTGPVYKQTKQWELVQINGWDRSETKLPNVWEAKDEWERCGKISNLPWNTGRCYWLYFEIILGGRGWLLAEILTFLSRPVKVPDSCHVWEGIDTTLPLMVPPVDYIEVDLPCLEKDGLDVVGGAASPPPVPVIINPDPWELDTELDVDPSEGPKWNGGYKNSKNLLALLCCEVICG